MSSDRVRRAKAARQYLLSASHASVRIRAVAVLVCASTTPEGRVCGELGRFEHDEAEGALALARAAGWDFRLRAARCRRCGNEGASFGKAGT